MLASDRMRNITHRRGMPKWFWVAFHEAYDLANAVRRRWRLYRMQRLDDHMLDDIGVTREELEWAISLPLRVNAALALHDRARRRRGS
ncbi:MAG: hypothetical protein ACR2RE_12825 [Geminicoccaceae bacterium]